MGLEQNRLGLRSELDMVAAWVRELSGAGTALLLTDSGGAITLPIDRPSAGTHTVFGVGLFYL